MGTHLRAMRNTFSAFDSVRRVRPCSATAPFQSLASGSGAREARLGPRPPLPLATPDGLTLRRVVLRWAASPTRILPFINSLPDTGATRPSVETDTFVGLR